MGTASVSTDPRDAVVEAARRLDAAGNNVAVNPLFDENNDARLAEGTEYYEAAIALQEALAALDKPTDPKPLCDKSVHDFAPNADGRPECVHCNYVVGGDSG